MEFLHRLALAAILQKFKHMKYYLILFGLLLLSCKNQHNDITVIEDEIYVSLNKSLTLNNENLLDEINQLFLKDIKIKNYDKENNAFESLQLLINDIQVNGSFCVIDSSLLQETINLRNKLNKLNFYDSQNLDFKFLYHVFNPIILKHADFYKTRIESDLTNDLIYNIGTINSDSVLVSFTLFLGTLRENLASEKLKSKGYYYTILLTTYGNFIYSSTEKKYCR